jgi:uncharacterized protein YqjF (DUF2071 family)
MRWLDLLFAHWPMDPDHLRHLIPPVLELDTFAGRAWLGVVPFTMANVGPRGIPAFPGFDRFPELNVRTYVRYQGQPGVWFLSLDARSWPTVRGARLVFHLPYVHAQMTSRHDGELVRYLSVRDDPDHPPARFEATYRPTGPIAFAAAGTFDDWATNRLRLFSADRGGRIWRGEIDHARWPLQPADGEIDAAPLAAVHGVTLPDDPPRLLFSRRLDVHGWLPVRD